MTSFANVTTNLSRLQFYVIGLRNVVMQLHVY
jgi:hypothetical protein